MLGMGGWVEGDGALHHTCSTNQTSKVVKIVMKISLQITFLKVMNYFFVTFFLKNVKNDFTRYKYSSELLHYFTQACTSAIPL